MKALFYPHKIEIKDYPFPTQKREKNFDIDCKNIKEVRKNRLPSEILLNSGEILFFDYAYRTHLQLFARLNNIPQVNRLDVWALLCNPFLDTETSERDQKANLNTLLNAGFLEKEIEYIRNKIQLRMMSLNTFMGEWAHLSHHDVLMAFDPKNPLNSSTFSMDDHFYDWCNEIATRAPLIQKVEKNLEATVDAKIGNIAYALSLLNSTIDFEDLKRELLKIVLNAYGSPRRHYHTLAHILSVLESVSLYQGTKQEKIALQLAAWFHDIIYNPCINDNEQQSVNYFTSYAAKLGIPTDIVDIAKKCILVTKNHLTASTNIEKTFVDADLLIFAQDKKTYKNYTTNIRQEYKHLTDKEFSTKRLTLLQNLQRHQQNTGKLYFFLHPMHEIQAKTNIDSEIMDISENLFV